MPPIDAPEALSLIDAPRQAYPELIVQQQSHVVVDDVVNGRTPGLASYELKQSLAARDITVEFEVVPVDPAGSDQDSCEYGTA